MGVVFHSHLFFADDLMLFCEASVGQAVVMDRILAEFCAFSGQKISINKSRVFTSPSTSISTRDMICQRLDMAHIDDLGYYLGMPILHGRMKTDHFNFLIDKVRHKLASWKTKCLSQAARLILIQAVLAFIPYYVMQSIQVPRSILDTIEKLCRQFFWADTDDQHHLHNIAWDKICRPKQNVRYVWPSLGSGQYTVSPGYDQLLGNTIGGVQTNAWDNIWRLKGPTRSNLFLWKCRHAILPTLGFLNTRHVSSCMICPLCFQHPETTLHALRDCTWAKSVWYILLSPEIRATFFDFFELSSWIDFNLEHLESLHYPVGSKKSSISGKRTGREKQLQLLALARIQLFIFPTGALFSVCFWVSVTSLSEVTDEEVASTSSKILPLPDDFIHFLKENGLDPSIYVAYDSIPRYIRLKPGAEAYIEEIEADIKCELQTVPWLPNFYSLPPDARVASSQSYQQGKIYGIDAASGAAVSALGISSGDHILDLCAAPGAKLCMMLDLLGNSGSATGVDIAKHRMAACRTMLQKYGLGGRCRLFVGDGAKFSIIPVTVHTDTEPGESVCEEKSEVYKKWTSKKTWKERKRARKAVIIGDSNLLSERKVPELIYYGQNSGVLGLSMDELYQVVTTNEICLYGYDKVLVDAECTHDGSIRHIQKYEHWGWDTLKRRVLDAERSDNLTNLQLQLLTNGFRLLKIGGFLVYSTCSLTFSQNEDVVDQFLSQNSSAVVVEVADAKSWPCKNGRIPKTLRFDPLISGTSGLFVAKFTKTAAV